MSFVLPVLSFVPSLRFVPVGSSLVFAMERKKRRASATPKTTNERNVWWTRSSCTQLGAVAPTHAVQMHPRGRCGGEEEEEGNAPLCKAEGKGFRIPLLRNFIRGVPRSPFEKGGTWT